MARSPLSYIGGKNRLAKQIIEIFPKHTTYVEPFAGGAQVFFRKDPSKVEVLNDLDDEIANFYRVCQNHYEELLRYFKFVVVSRSWFELLKRTDPSTLTDIQRAARYLYLLKNCFASLVVNPVYHRNVVQPPGFNLESLPELIEKSHKRLERVQIECAPYEEVLKRYDRVGTLFYLDPPYYGRKLYHFNFNHADFEQLAEQLAKLKSKFILSLNDVPEVRTLFRRFHIVTTPSTATEYSYDPMGRIAQTYSCAPANCGTGQGWLMGYTYDYAGDMISLSSFGTTIQYGIDSAGRVNQVTSGWVDSQHPATLATVNPNNGYWPTGALRQMTLGNNLTESMVEDPLGQPCRINVNSSGTLLSNCADALPSGNVQDMNANFNFGAGDNGNLAGFAASGHQNFNRSYTYDTLNRLQTMSAPGDACSGLSWNVDPWGNRLAQNVTGGTCWSPTVSVDTGNHLTGSPYQYDAAGNLLKDGNHTYAYDAESRVTQVDSGATATYVYDASGNRVDKKTGGMDYEYLFDQGGHINTVFNNGAMQRMFVYVGSRTLAEYFQNTTYFVHTDNLGSTRLLTGMDQSIQESDDYYPYGESITTGTDDILKFTGKERDTESGLDNFGARYYGSAMGRFMTPDWAARPIAVPYALFGDPQSLNLYGYVRNDPVTLADADGHGCHSTPDASCNMVSPEALCPEGQSCNPLDQAQQKPNAPTNTPAPKPGLFHRLWQHFGNWFHGHSWNYVRPLREKVTHIVLPAVPRPAVTYANDAAGLVGLLAGEKAGRVLGPAGALVSISNNRDPMNIFISVLGTIPGPDVGVAFNSALADGFDYGMNHNDPLAGKTWQNPHFFDPPDGSGSSGDLPNYYDEPHGGGGSPMEDCEALGFCN